MIKFTRGDTYKFKFQRKDANNEPILVKAEKMWFTIKKNNKTTEKLVQKTLADIVFDNEGFYHVTIEHDDTKNLKYKKYVCDIQVENAGVVTTIFKDTITLDKEVTFEGGNN